MNLIPLFDMIDRCVPFKVRRSLPYLKATEVLAIVLTDTDGNMREGIELALYAGVILALSLFIVRAALAV